MPAERHDRRERRRPGRREPSLGCATGRRPSRRVDRSPAARRARAAELARAIGRPAMPCGRIVAADPAGTTLGDRTGSTGSAGPAHVVRLPTAGRHNAANALAVAGGRAASSASTPAAIAARPRVVPRRRAPARAQGRGRAASSCTTTTAITRRRSARRSPRSASASPDRRVWAVYEPLTFHRTAALLDEFADALADGGRGRDRRHLGRPRPGHDDRIAAGARRRRGRATPGHPAVAPGLRRGDRDLAGRRGPGRRRRARDGRRAELPDRRAAARGARRRGDDDRLRRLAANCWSATGGRGRTFDGDAWVGLFTEDAEYHGDPFVAATGGPQRHPGISRSSPPRRRRRSSSPSSAIGCRARRSSPPGTRATSSVADRTAVRFAGFMTAGGRTGRPDRPAARMVDGATGCVGQEGEQDTMAGEVSFDVVSEFDDQELRNALDQVRREVAAALRLQGRDGRPRAGQGRARPRHRRRVPRGRVKDLIESKAIRRDLSLKIFDWGKVEPAGGNKVRQQIALRRGLPDDSPSGSRSSSATSSPR